MIKVILPAALLLGLLAVSCSVSVSPRSRALIVSTGLDYTECTVNDLHGTVDDAKEVALCLSKIYANMGIESEVQVITSCTAVELMSVLRELAPTENDVFIFYWSGHGHVDKDGMFLVTYPDGSQAYSRFYVSDLCEFTEGLCCPSVIILDACYAGRPVFEGPPLTKTAILASCSADELSMVTHIRTVEGTVQAHSIFTAALLEVLGWQHSVDLTGFLGFMPPRMTAADLGEEIRQKLGRTSQHPVFGRTDVPVLIVP